MAEASPPSRVVLVFGGLFTQLIGAVCLVLGLASFPAMHDLHRPIYVVAGWVAGAVLALVCGGLAYRARAIPLALAAILDASFGYMLPRKDSALGALEVLLPQGDVALAETIVTVVAIGMFVVAAICVVAIPFAVRYRRWEATDEGIRVSRTMTAMTAADTLKGVGKIGGKRAPVTMVIHTSALDRRSRPWVIVAVAATLVGTGVAVIVEGGFGRHGKRGTTAGSGSDSGRTRSDRGSAHSAAAPRDAGLATSSAAAALDASAVDAGPPRVDSPEHLLAALHDALARGDTPALTALLAPDVLAVGADADELADGRDAALAILARDLGATGAITVEPAHTTIGHEGKLAWIAEDLALGAHRYVTSVLATPDSTNRWSVAALTWAVAVPNDTAFKLARAGQLPVPAPVADRTTGAPELAEAARAAFGSRDGFVAARSKRADAFNFGSAPGERMMGGDLIRRAFAHMTAQLSLHDGVTAGMLGDRAGWSETNVDFTAPDREGTTVTQTFRVLAAWLREDGGWRIVHTQFSNARPR